MNLKLNQMVIAGAAALLTLAFFMPWLSLDLGFYSQRISGAVMAPKLYQLLSLGDALNGMSGQASANRLYALLFYVLYLIPIAAIALIFRVFKDQPRIGTLKLQSTVTGALSLLLLVLFGILLLSALGGEAGVSLLGFGYVLSFLLSAGLIAAPFLLGDDRTVQLSPEQQERLSRQGQEVLSKTSGWIKGRQSQVNQAMGERRIQGALGRPLNRDLLLPDDRVLAARGSTITHQLIEEARSHGVLGMLLSSVEAPGTASDKSGA